MHRPSAIASRRATAKKRRAALEALEPRQLLSTVYVDAHSTAPTPDGTSWANAFTDLQQALAVAVSGDQIHVAQGTYTPTNTTDQTISFQLKNGVEIDGGYAGVTSPTPDARDIDAYPSILSGDIGTAGDNLDNSYTVVVGSGTSATAKLDGFTISGGHAIEGGGFYNSAGSPTVSNCTIMDNSALYGGGMYNGNGSAPYITDCAFVNNIARLSTIRSECAGMFNSASSPMIVNCTFNNNIAYDPFGGMYNTAGSSPTLIGCTFVQNTATGGAAIGNHAASPTLIDCMFLGNSTRSGGGAISSESSSTLNLTNCLFIGNSASYGGAIYSVSSTLYLNNSILWNNSANDYPEVYVDANSALHAAYSDIQGGYAGTGNINADPMFYRNPSPGTDGVWGTADDDYGDLRLLPNSPCIDAGLNSAVPAGVTTDLAGNARIFDFPGAHDPGAIVDMGAYEANTNLGAMHLSSGQSVILPAGHHTFSATQLILDPGATLDLKDDSLVIDYTGSSPLGTWNGSAYTGIEGSIASGANGGAGIITSAANGHTTLGVAEASDVLGLSGNQTAIWNGQTVDATAVLVKYTYTGDANLDGKVNGDDYFAIDSHVTQNGSVFGWNNGDFNYDGHINGDDYFLIDSTINQHGAPLAAMKPPANLLDAAVGLSQAPANEWAEITSTEKPDVDSLLANESTPGLL